MNREKFGSYKSIASLYQKPAFPRGLDFLSHKITIILTLDYVFTPY